MRKSFLLRFPLPSDNAFGRPAELQFGESVIDVSLFDRLPRAQKFPLDIVNSMFKNGGIWLAALQYIVDGALTSFHLRSGRPAIRFSGNNSRLTNVPVAISNLQLLKNAKRECAFCTNE